MTPMRLRKWREVKRRPVPGSSPDDRILHGPGCNRPKRVCADSFPATPSPRPPRIGVIRGMRFSGMTESIGPIGVKTKTISTWGWVPPPVGRPHAPVQGRDGRNAPFPSSAMSSDRLFLDRVARQHCPSPLHRHTQNNTPLSVASAKGDISILLGRDISILP